MAVGVQAEQQFAAPGIPHQLRVRSGGHGRGSGRSRPGPRPDRRAVELDGESVGFAAGGRGTLEP